MITQVRIKNLIDEVLKRGFAVSTYSPSELLSLRDTFMSDTGYLFPDILEHLNTIRDEIYKLAKYFVLKDYLEEAVEGLGGYEEDNDSHFSVDSSYAFPHYAIRPEYHLTFITDFTSKYYLRDKNDDALKSDLSNLEASVQDLQYRLMSTSDAYGNDTDFTHEYFTVSNSFYHRRGDWQYLPQWDESRNTDVKENIRSGPYGFLREQTIDKVNDTKEERVFYLHQRATRADIARALDWSGIEYMVTAVPDDTTFRSEVTYDVKAAARYNGWYRISMQGTNTVFSQLGGGTFAAWEMQNIGIRQSVDMEMAYGLIRGYEGTLNVYNNPLNTEVCIIPDVVYNIHSLKRTRGEQQFAGTVSVRDNQGIDDLYPQFQDYKGFTLSKDYSGEVAESEEWSLTENRFGTVTDPETLKPRFPYTESNAPEGWQNPDSPDLSMPQIWQDILKNHWEDVIGYQDGWEEYILNYDLDNPVMDPDNPSQPKGWDTSSTSEISADYTGKDEWDHGTLYYIVDYSKGFE